MKRQSPAFGDEDPGSVQNDLRQKIAEALLAHAEPIAADAVALFPFTGAEPLGAEYCARLGRLLINLLAMAVRDGRLDARGAFITDLHRVVLERALSIAQIFSFAYLGERAAADELALSESIGATSEPWPLVAQLIRRGSFDLLAAYTEHAHFEPSNTTIIDTLTTLHTRPLLDAVLAKELERAGRYGFAISLILFDVDRLSAINQEHGYGVGDRILERLGILIRTYFRQHDWVARHSEDSIAVLLTRADAEHAADLAERVRATVEDRLGFTDHRSDKAVVVTLSAAVINVQVSVGDVIDPERLLADAEAAVERAKRLGRNRVECVNGYSPSRTLPHSSPSA